MLHTPLVWRTACVLLTTLLSLSCDRVAYYSITGSTGAGTSDDDSGPSSSPSTIATGPGSVTRPMVLQGIATCAEALYGDVAQAAAELDAAASAYQSAATEANETAVRAAWAKTIGLWQQAEVLRVGVAGPASLPEGQSLRDYVYSWPLVSRCLVDQIVVNQKYADDDFAVTGLINTRGLYAAEYLLFHEPSDNGCSASSSINAQGTWAALGGQEVGARKREYAAVLATDVAGKTAGIKASWGGDDGFSTLLATAGGGDSPFESDQAALNAISDGLFYLEKEVKDLKLGLPLGKLPECVAPPCLEAVESQYALVSRDHIRNNLVGFQRVFEGCDAAAGEGFDDLLRTLGAHELADRMSTDIEAAIVTADELPSADLRVLLERDEASVEGMHAAVKRITDALKTDFVTVLDLELPATVEGDND